MILGIFITFFILLFKNIFSVILCYSAVSYSATTDLEDYPSVDLVQMDLLSFLKDILPSLLETSPVAQGDHLDNDDLDD